MKLRTMLLGAATVSALVATSAQAETVLRWTSQGDALTMDPMGKTKGRHPRWPGKSTTH